MRKLRITALILVCLGLLIGGIGIGMCFVEASSFTYRDTVRLNMTQEDTVFTSIYLDEEEKLTGYEIYDSNSQNIVLSPDAQIPQIQTDSQLEEGVVQVEVAYRSIPGFTPYLLTASLVNNEVQRILYISNGFMQPTAILSVKDQLLSDIKNRRIGEYQFAEITGVTFTVNPADRGKIELAQNMSS